MACETGVVGAALPDEVVALPAALFQAGFAGVVASLWSVYDASTALLLVRFYQLWRVEGKAPAVALREAQCWLRDANHVELRDHRARDLSELAKARLRDLVFGDDGSGASSMVAAPPYVHPVHWAAFYLTGV